MPELDKFQYDALAFLDKAQGRAVIADPMGARKTGTTLAWIDEVSGRCEYERMLVVAPAAVHGHWAREAKRFTVIPAHIAAGTPKKRALALARRGIYITTYEAMKNDQTELLKAKFDIVVYDEGHKLKGRTTQVALSANRFASSVPHCVILTGTPVLNHPSELWQYLRMLDGKTYRSYWKWVMEHFIVESRHFAANRFPTRIIHDFRSGHEDIVREQLSGLFLQRDYDELFGGQKWIEEPEHIEYPVTLSSAERKAYDQLVKFNWTLINGQEVTTSNGLDLSTRLAQFTSDWGGIEESAENGTKVKAAIELAEDLLERDEKVIIFTKYKATAYRIADGLPGVVSYTGDHPPEIKERKLGQFVNNEIRGIVGTLDSMGEGVDGLQHDCANVIMVDRWWVPAKNDQAIGRLRRSGQERRVTVHHIFAEETIDEAITTACLRKTNVIELLRGQPLTEAIYGRV